MAPSISPRRQQRPPVLAWLHGPRWQQRPLRLACPLWGHTPQTLTWSQVITQTLGIWRALFGNRSHGHQKGSPRLLQCHMQKYGPWQLPRHKHHHRPWWQAGHLHQPTLHLSCLSRSTSLLSTSIFLPPSLSHFLTLFSVPTIVPRCLNPLDSWLIVPHQTNGACWGAISVPHAEA